MTKKIHANWINWKNQAQYKKAVLQKFYRTNMLLCLKEVLIKTDEFWLVKFILVKYGRIVLLRDFKFSFKGLQWTDPWPAGKLGTSGCSWRYPERGGSSRANITSGM